MWATCHSEILIYCSFLSRRETGKHQCQQDKATYMLALT